MTVAMYNSRFCQSLCAVVATCAVIAYGPVRQASKCGLSTSPPQVVAPGAHCPLMLSSSSQSKSSPHHCPMHQTAMQRRCELHCACSQHPPASSPEFASLRFVLPWAISSLVPPVDVFQGPDLCIFFPQVSLSPPRSSSTFPFPRFGLTLFVSVFGHSSPWCTCAQALSGSSEHALGC